MKIDIDTYIGQKYNHLTITENLGIADNGWTYVRCDCDCGNVCNVRFSDVKTNRVKSCGCLRGTKNPYKVHTVERLYGIWRGMKTRCYNSNSQEYKRYGGRGIEMCEEWKHNYIHFKRWAEENGYDAGAKRGECTLDRIDVNGNYEPSNCRWVNMKVQSNNTRRNHIIEYNNEKHTVKEWSEITGIDYHTLESRILKGWPVHSLFRPVKGGV